MVVCLQDVRKRRPSTIAEQAMMKGTYGNRLLKIMARSHTRRRVRVRIPVPGDIPMATVVQCRKFTLDQNRDRYPSLIGYCAHFWDRAPSPGEVSVYVNEP